MTLICEVCNYSTDRLDNFNRHKAKKKGCKPKGPDAAEVADAAAAYNCTKCDRSFTILESLNRHAAVCDGSLQYQCSTCQHVGKTRNEAYLHKLSCPGVASTSVNTEGNQNIANSDHSGNSTIVDSYNTTNINIGNINVNIGADKINDFTETNIQRVIDDILANPARIQLAHKRGMPLLHQAVVSEMHFTGAKENHNILRVDSTRRAMYVRLQGSRRMIDKYDAIFMTQQNFETIVNTPAIKALLTDKEDPIFEIPTTDAEVLSLRKTYQSVMVNRNLGHREKELVVPQRLPPEFARTLWEEKLLATLSDIEYHPSPDKFKAHVMEVCERFMYLVDTWFAGIGTGWRMCKDEDDVVASVHGVLNDLKNSLISRLANEKSVDEKVLHACRALPRFPDKELAERSINWMLERDVPRGE